jgi:hypothetical protein
MFILSQLIVKMSLKYTYKNSKLLEDSKRSDKPFFNYNNRNRLKISLNQLIFVRVFKHTCLREQLKEEYLHRLVLMELPIIRKKILKMYWLVLKTQWTIP